MEEEEQGRLGLHLASANDKLLDLGAEDFILLGSWAPLSSIALYCCCFKLLLFLNSVKSIIVVGSRPKIKGNMIKIILIFK